MRAIDADEMLYELTHWKDEKGWYHDNRTDVYHISEIRLVCDRQPTIEPEQKTGEWIYGENDGQDGWYCSECDGFIPWYYDYYGLDNIDFITDFKTCSFCGAKMISYTGCKE